MSQDLIKKINEARKGSPIALWTTLKNNIAKDNTVTGSEEEQILKVLDKFVGDQAIDLQDEELERKLDEFLKQYLDATLISKALKLFADAYEKTFDRSFSLKDDVDRLTTQNDGDDQ